MQIGRVAIAGEQLGAGLDRLARSPVQHDRDPAPHEHRGGKLGSGDRHGAAREKHDMTAPAVKPERLGRQIAARPILHK